MKILIIGGSGFVSGNLARRALSEGHQVWTVTRGQRETVAGATALVADRHDEAAFAQAVSGAGTTWDLVADCIGYEPPAVVQDLREFAGRAGHLVFISSDFVYDPRRRCFAQGEDSEHYLAEGYGGLKRRCELELLAGGGALPWTVLRPCHIYGPGSQLGCLPAAARDPKLRDKLRAGEAVELVGGGHFLQSPLFVEDLAAAILSAPAAPGAAGGIFNIAGPDLVESRTYYELIAELLGVELAVAELPVDKYRREHPEHASFLCHRINDLTRLRAAGLKVLDTTLRDGLAQHVASMA